MRYLCFFYQLPLFYEGIWPCSGIWIKKGNLTYQMVRRLEKSGELSKETVFIDGTKLEACANKYTFVWKKSVGKWEAKMYGRIQEAVRLLNQEHAKIQNGRTGSHLFEVKAHRKSGNPKGLIKVQQKSGVLL